MMADADASTPDPDETIAALRDELAVVIEEARKMEAEASGAKTPLIGVPFAPAQWTLNREAVIARTRRRQLEFVDEMLKDAEQRVRDT